MATKKMFRQAACVAAIAIGVAVWANSGAPTSFAIVAVMWATISACTERRPLRHLPWVCEHHVMVVAASIASYVYRSECECATIGATESVAQPCSWLLGELVGSLLPWQQPEDHLKHSDEQRQGEPTPTDAPSASSLSTALGYLHHQTGKGVTDALVDKDQDFAQDPAADAQGAAADAQGAAADAQDAAAEDVLFQVEQFQSSFKTFASWLTVALLALIATGLAEPSADVVSKLSCIPVGMCLAFRIYLHGMADQTRARILFGRSTPLYTIIYMAMLLGSNRYGKREAIVFLSGRLMWLIYLAYLGYIAILPYHRHANALILSAVAIVQPTMSKVAQLLEPAI